MGQRWWYYLDRRPFCVVTRPLLGLLLGGAGGGAFGALAGLVYGALHGVPAFAIAAALHAAFAGAVAGLLMGVCSAVDRATWPGQGQDGSGESSSPGPSINGHTERIDPPSASQNRPALFPRRAWSVDPASHHPGIDPERR
jgi:hypothetical protein